MKARVDDAKCQGHARCLVTVPQIFQEDEQGHAFVAVDLIPADLESDVQLAALNCPEEAITVDTA